MNKRLGIVRKGISPSYPSRKLNKQEKEEDDEDEDVDVFESAGEIYEEKVSEHRRRRLFQLEAHCIII